MNSIVDLLPNVVRVKDPKYVQMVDGFVSAQVYRQSERIQREIRDGVTLYLWDNRERLFADMARPCPIMDVFWSDIRVVLNDRLNTLDKAS